MPRIDVQQCTTLSLRHANSRITLDVYTQAVTPAKRQAQSKVVKMILPSQISSGKEAKA